MSGASEVVEPSPRGVTRGLRSRIAITTGAVMLAGVVVLVLAFALLLHRIVGDTVDGILDDRSAAVSATVELQSGSLTIRETQDEALDQTAWIFDAAGTLVEGPAGADALQQSVTRLASARSEMNVTDGSWRLRATPIVSDDGTTIGVVVVGVSLTPYESTERLALLGTGLLGLVIAAGATIGVSWAVARALRPVAAMARSAASWSAERLDRRFDLGPPTDELTELGQVLDSLLERVSTVILGEQRLTQELAHELRSPLTVIKAEAELATLDATMPDVQRGRFERILTSVDRLTGVIETLMSVARGTMPDDETADASAVVAAVVASVGGGPAVAGQGADARVRIETIGGAARIATPERVAVRALAPLVDNAVRHARSIVTIRVSTSAEAVRIDVEDDGDGIGADETTTIFDAGVRGATSTGAGLGLPLAQRIARAAGGEVSLVTGRPARFMLELPRRSRD